MPSPAQSKNLMNKTLSSTDLKGIKLFKRGKVRDVYDLGDKLLIISTDRISCFDVVLPSFVPQKGKVLTTLSAFWFEFTQDVIPNHLISTQVDDFPSVLTPYQEEIKNRSMLTKKAELIPFECVVRGYLSGSGWKEYQPTASICGIKLPKGLRESDRLPEPIFTPATKEETGHDINVSQEFMEKKLGKDLSRQLRDYSIALYKKANRYAEGKGIIIADTKFEFGFLNPEACPTAMPAGFHNEIILIDEVLTPDSSRFWPKKSYQPGKSQPSFDKQFVRDYLETLDWNKTPPAPSLPANIIQETSRKYLEICELLIGKASVIAGHKTNTFLT